MATQLHKRQILGWEIEPVQRSITRNTQAGGDTFAATAAGTTTTTVATSRLTVTTNDGYVGNLLHCIGPQGSKNLDHWAEIREFAASTDTLTHDAFPAATAENDLFEICLPPDPIVAITTAGTQAISTYRTADTDDEYVGDQLVVRVSDNLSAGTKVTITDFAPTNGGFSGSFAAATAVGDLLHVRNYPDLWATPTFAAKYDELAHPAQRGDFGQEPMVHGPRSWTADVVLALKGAGSSAASGSIAVLPPCLHKPLSSFMSSSRMYSIAAGAGSTTSLITIASGLPYSGSVFMDANGRAACVVSMSSATTMTVRPALSVAPLTSDLLTGGVAYAPMTSGHRTMTLEFDRELERVMAYGGLPKVSIEIKRGEVPKVKFSFEGGFFYKVPVARPAGLNPVYDSAVAKAATNGRLILSNAGSDVELLAKNVDIDLGITLQKEDIFTLPDGTYGMRLVDMKPTIKVDCALDVASPNNTWAELNRYYNQRIFSLSLQHGKGLGGTFFMFADRAEWVSPTDGVDGELSSISFTARVLASGLTNVKDLILGFI